MELAVLRLEVQGTRQPGCHVRGGPVERVRTSMWPTKFDAVSENNW